MFAKPAESGNISVTADTIMDFAHGSDHIDVHAIDADGTQAVNQDFVFGGAFTAGHIRAVQSGNDTVVQFNTDNDLEAEMAIVLKTFTAATLTGGDFVL